MRKLALPVGESGFFALLLQAIYRNMANPQERRIRTIDGWRGVAILLVLADHALHDTRFNTQPWANLGCRGVDVFFVISGYIITLRFLVEREKTTTLSLGNFYFRRAFRILPLVFAYLTTICTLSLFLNLVDFHQSELWGSLFFYRNYEQAVHPLGVYTTHFWSLSIEEHFYLLWPALLLFWGNRRALWFSATAAAACGMWRLYDCTHPDSALGRLLPGSTPALRMLRTDARFDGLLLGCALAILLSRPEVRGFIHRNFPKETTLIAAILVLINLQTTHNWPTLSTYCLVCLMLAATLVVQEGLAHQFLNSRFMVWLGTISYSVYVWQQLFLLRPEHSASPLGILGTFPVNVICVLMVSSASFYWLERPCIALGKRLSTRMGNPSTASIVH